MQSVSSLAAGTSQSSTLYSSEFVSLHPGLPALTSRLMRCLAVMVSSRSAVAKYRNSWLPNLGTSLPYVSRIERHRDGLFAVLPTEGAASLGMILSMEGGEFELEEMSIMPKLAARCSSI